MTPFCTTPGITAKLQEFGIARQCAFGTGGHRALQHDVGHGGRRAMGNLLCSRARHVDPEYFRLDGPRSHCKAKMDSRVS